MLANLAEAGLIVGAPMDEADVIVINTCGFLSAARDESLEVIAEALDHKREGRARRVVVAGCLVNRDTETLYEQAPGIDAIVGVNDCDEILSAVTGDGRFSKFSPYCGGLTVSDSGRFRLTPPHTAYLRISEGCSQRCTFCTIPDIRGPFRSKDFSAVLSEARELIDAGAVELNIIAQDTTAYGMDLGADSPDLARLLQELDGLDGLDGLQWLRLLYTYPRRFNDALIETIAASRRVVPYVDIPLQHISTDVLKRMGRGVNREGTEKLLDQLRNTVDSLVLRTTFIVGFPGESESEFRELLDFVKATRFDAMGVFAFSPEPGTPAATMPNQISDDVKADRVETLMLAQQEIAFEKNRSRVGSDIEILVDGVSSEGYCIGRYFGQAPDIDSVCILTEDRPAGAFVGGKVVNWSDYDLMVEPQ